MFQEFPKIARLNREMIVTEKIDGTNAHVQISDCCQESGSACSECAGVPWIASHTENGVTTRLAAGSRTRYITPDNDNFGFARWVTENMGELLKLGPGRHYGEWWGPGIQRGYGQREKRFSLFNTGRWVDQSQWASDGLRGPLGPKQAYAPACCYVVPVLYIGKFSTEMVGTQIERLRTLGSVASPGFMRPEGVVVFHTASRQQYKVTLEKDEEPKSKWQSK